MKTIMRISSLIIFLAVAMILGAACQPKLGLSAQEKSSMLKAITSESTEPEIIQMRAAAFFAEAEKKRLDKELAMMLGSFRETDPVTKTIALAKHLENLLPAFEKTCGVKLGSELQALGGASQDDQVRLVYEKCKLDRFKLVDAAKVNTGAKNWLFILAIYTSLDQLQGLGPIDEFETKLMKMALTGET